MAIERSRSGWRLKALCRDFHPSLVKYQLPKWFLPRTASLHILRLRLWVLQGSIETNIELSCGKPCAWDQDFCCTLSTHVVNTSLRSTEQSSSEALSHRVPCSNIHGEGPARTLMLFRIIIVLLLLDVMFPVSCPPSSTDLAPAGLSSLPSSERAIHLLILAVQGKHHNRRKRRSDATDECPHPAASSWSRLRLFSNR